MKNILISIVFVLLLTSFASAEILLNEQPREIYNLGDAINFPITVKAISDTTGIFKMDLLCNGKEINFYKNGISLLYGEESAFSPSLILSQDVIATTLGFCKVQATLGLDKILTNGFKISNWMSLEVSEKQTEFTPSTSVLIQGESIKDNGKGANGIIDLQLILDPLNNESGILERVGTITNGFFSINFSLPEDIKAGEHQLKLFVYEKNIFETKTNTGFLEYTIYVQQIPTNVEILFEDSLVEPGTDLKVKAILRDQTGEKIESNVIITIKNQDDKIMEQIDQPTDEFLSYPILRNEPPTKWAVVAISKKLTSEANFKIKEIKKVDIKLINKTIFVTNIGNIPYCNETILVKIGNESLNIKDCLEVDELQKYILAAPDGDYDVEVVMGGESIITGNVALTGRATSLKKASQGFISGYPIIWIFVVILLGFIAFLIYKKGYKRSFFGRMHLKKKGRKETRLEGHRSVWEKNKKDSIGKTDLVHTKNKAELSLSIKGNRQSASIICLDIKNIKDVKINRGNSPELFQKIVSITEEKDAFIYENQGNLFFIFSPEITKTFRNEKAAIQLADKIRHLLLNYNKLAKQKIEFGLSVDYGEIIAKQEAGILQFMSIERSISNAKKVASLSEEEIYLSQKMNDRLGANVRTTKHEKSNQVIYTIKELRDQGEHKAFISSFLKRLEDDKKKQAK